MKPEERSRQQIDALLSTAGWGVQDYAQFNLGAARGVAIRESPLSTGPTDYLLVVDRQAVGVVKAKKGGEALTSVEIQSAKYREGHPGALPVARSPLPFAYETTGVETRFTNGLEPDPRSRPVFAFHRPETLAEWLALNTLDRLFIHADWEVQMRPWSPQHWKAAVNMLVLVSILTSLV